MTTLLTTKDRGLHTLDGDQLSLLRELDTLLLSWAGSVDAQERRYPFLLEAPDLDRIDYYDNFPHLGLGVAPLRPEQVAAHLATAERPVQTLPSEATQDVHYGLPSAACYSVYLNLQNTTLPAEGARFTTVATCFRNENHFEGFRRLLGFSMREIVYVGNRAGAQDHLVAFKPRVLELARELGLSMHTDVATDPFFDQSGSRAKMQALFPVKEEFIVDDLAIGSVNYHRNFFGERCSIDAGSEPAHTSCVAFGLERWLSVLTTRFGSAAAAARAVASLR